MIGFVVRLSGESCPTEPVVARTTDEADLVN